MKKRKVLGITGIRSEYFLQRSIFRAIMDHPDLEFELIVTGAHLSPLHGYTVTEIESDGFPIVDRVESLLYSNRDAARVKGAAIQLLGLSHIVDAVRPDWLLAPTDREEAIGLALCGAYMNIATAHYGAGDRARGNVDDVMRHAISRLAHLLLTTHEDARERLIRSGEEEWRVHNVGHAGIDRLRTTPVLEPASLAKALGVGSLNEPYVVVIQHPISSQIDEAGAQMRETLAAVKELDIEAFVIYPNSDAGSDAMINAIREYDSVAKIHIFRTIPDEAFVNLLGGAALLIGNSSLGILEAPFLRLPAMNIGDRQSGRHHAENVSYVPHDRQQIARQMRSLLFNDEVRASARACSNPFGEGHTGERVAELLATTPLDSRLFQKDLTY